MNSIFFFLHTWLKLTFMIKYQMPFKVGSVKIWFLPTLSFYLVGLFYYLFIFVYCGIFFVYLAITSLFTFPFFCPLTVRMLFQCFNCPRKLISWEAFIFNLFELIHLIMMISRIIITGNWTMLWDLKVVLWLYIRIQVADVVDLAV